VACRRGLQVGAEPVAKSEIRTQLPGAWVASPSIPLIPRLPLSGSKRLPRAKAGQPSSAWASESGVLIAPGDPSSSSGDISRFRLVGVPGPGASPLRRHAGLPDPASRADKPNETGMSLNRTAKASCWVAKACFWWGFLSAGVWLQGEGRCQPASGPGAWVVCFGSGLFDRFCPNAKASPEPTQGRASRAGPTE